LALQPRLRGEYVETRRQKLWRTKPRINREKQSLATASIPLHFSGKPHCAHTPPGAHLDHHPWTQLGHEVHENLRIPKPSGRLLWVRKEIKSIIRGQNSGRHAK